MQVDRQCSIDDESISIDLGESCRLTATICSYDDHCCSGRCLCRRWTITGEERCVRKCF